MAYGRAGFGKLLEIREATFGAGGVYADAKHKGPIDGMMTPYNNNDPDEAIRVADVSHAGKYGLQHGDFDLTFHLYQATATPPVAAWASDASVPFVARRVGEALGDYVVGGFTTVGVGSTTTNVVVAASASFFIGQAVVTDVSVAGSGQYEVSFVTDVVDGTHIEVLPAFSLAPVSGRNINGSYTAAQANDGKFTIGSCAWQYISSEYRWQVERKGCRPRSLKIKMTPREFGEVALGYSSAIYSDNPAAPAAPAESTFASPLLPLAEGRFIYDTTAYAIKDASLDITIPIVPILDPADRTTEAIEDFVVGAPRVTKLSCTLYLDNSAELNAQPWTNEYTGQSAVMAMLSFCKQPGEGFAVQIPAARIVEKPVLGNTDGIATVALVFEPGTYTADTTGGGGAGDDIADTPIRIAWC